MTMTQTIASGMAGAMLLALAGCATGMGDAGSQSSVSTRLRAVTQREAGDLAFQYRRQAAEYRELARRLEMEAQIATARDDNRSDQVQRSLETAKALWASAEQADELAREYRRQTPHGQVY
ncbi:MAG: hypothetical protein HZB35_00150 [Nitrospirae bacterium]|nr:hypothetical protein [Nitrospirota bacterium]